MDGLVDWATVLRWALVVVVLLCGAGLVALVWHLESLAQQHGPGRD